jgi:ATP-dependent DNA helicase RecG
VHGNLFEQVKGCLDLLHTKYMKAEIRYEGAQRIEEFPYPDAALREALLNAIAHKDYGGGTPIQISVYDHKIMFWNEGQLPEHWTVEQLSQKHPSKPRNPDVANAFFRAGLIESWGRGTLKILTACEERGLPTPVYKYDFAGFVVEMTRKTLGKTPGKTRGKTPGMILAELRQNSALTIPEIAALIGKSESAVERAIKKLRKDQRLERVGAAKGGSWKVLGEDE